MSSAVHGTLQGEEGGENSSVIADLRALLCARFPDSAPVGLKEAQASEKGRKVLPTGIPDWDALAQGLRLGEVTEVCGRLGGTALIMESLLEAGARAGWLGAWVDGGDSLEVADWHPEWLHRMLWVRCQHPLSALKAADLLLRDGNLSWVTLDLQGASPRELRRVGMQHWHRFHRLTQQQGSALLVLTPAPMVEGARVRVVTQEAATLDSLERPRSQLRTDMSVQVFVRGRQPGVALDGSQSLQKIA